jgi:hypothetical protein
MARLNWSTSEVGGPLQQLLMCEAIEPGDPPSYEVCKVIMAFHPLGAKMTDSPIALAQSQERKITVQDGPEEVLVEAFTEEWRKLEVDKNIFNHGRLARCYGIASTAVLVEGVATDQPLDLKNLWKKRIVFNVYDPLNTAGSLTLNQDPTAPDFQKVKGISVSGNAFHRTRAVVLQNEDPLYILWTESTYGFTGRSVFQRALYPLKSFLRSMIADDLLESKVALLVAKMQQPGSIVDQAMEVIAGLKRELLKIAMTGNVLEIGQEDSVESLDFTNMEGPHALARKNILDNVATAADMPAVILNQETFAEGFGEGTEDAKRVAQYVARVRVWLGPLYRWYDEICMHRAWSPEFYEGLQARFKDWADVTYEVAFQRFSNSFRANWPNLLEEPDSEKIKVDDVKFRAVIAAFEVVEPVLGGWPEGVVALLQWVQDSFNEREDLFPSKLNLDLPALLEHLEDQQAQQQAAMAQGQGQEDQQAGQGLQEPRPAPPFSPRDAGQGAAGDRIQRVARALSGYSASVAQLPDLRRELSRRAGGDGR